ncbi:MAG: tRNA (adenosine(37)-N6)-dimethylallyltransferase MiaA [Flavobacteriales bacterium]|nr:tRNA (adenosine(37)-N6)-dimethylallyltransferase MiaA [Flavobacteriales bacterium]
MSEQKKYLIVIGGPTASGKTALAIELAKHFDTEIISADSRQFYKELNIGVAKPSLEELQSAKHHFIGHISIHNPLSAGEFEKQALSVLENLFKTRDVAIMVGGSGLFINAILHGFHEAPKDDGSIRKKLENQYAQHGLTYLQNELKRIDSDYYNKIDLQNPQRLMRAIERVLLSGKTNEEQTAKQLSNRHFEILEFAIDYPREELYNRINQRVDEMIKNGLIAEVENLAPFKQLNALQTVGYAELFDYFDGKSTLNEAVDKIKQNTRRYAKRQITWFKNKSNSAWIDNNIGFDFIKSHLDFYSTPST